MAMWLRTGLRGSVATSRSLYRSGCVYKVPNLLVGGVGSNTINRLRSAGGISGGAAFRTDSLVELAQYDFLTLREEFDSRLYAFCLVRDNMTCSMWMPPTLSLGPNYIKREGKD